MSSTESQKRKGLYQFGPFRVDPEKEILLREGEPVPLTPKTFQTLLVLVRHNTEVVTKDDLMKTVWPDTFVEESSLTRNIFMLRKALGESSQDHQYILTVPGRGYRLTESVRLIPEHELNIIAASHSKVDVQAAETKPWGWIAVAVILLVAAAVCLFRLVVSPRILTEKDTVILADFTNSTGDPIFDATLREGMTVQLEQSPFLSLISDQRIRHTLRLMGRSADAPLTSDVAREICARTGSAAVLEGSIVSFGTQYVLGLRARSCHSGNILDDEQAQAPKKEDVLNALSKIATKLRTRVGESLATVQQHDTPLAEATTPSLEALEAYSAALKVHYSSGAIAALPMFERAVEIDPEFAMAHSFLGRVYANLDESDRSAESISKAWQLRNRVSDRERFGIATRYYALVTGNLEQMRQTCDAWTRTYPRDPQPHIGLSLYYKAIGQYENAETESRRAIEVDPDFSVGYSDLGASQVDLNRLAEAENTLGQAARRGLETDEFIMLDHRIAFLKGDAAAMAQAAARARQRSAGENWISAREALALAYSGHLQQARIASRHAVDHAQLASQNERAGVWEAGDAVREAMFGIAPEAKRRATAALSLSRDRETEYGAALALALSGEVRGAQQLADDLEKRFPEDTAVQFSYLPVLRAHLALDHGAPAKAVELLQSAIPYELGTPRSAVHALFGSLYPIYVRGQAYQALGRGVDSAAEFQKILDHRGIVVSDPIGALARLQLGRAYVLAEEKTKAKSCYQDFLTLWKDADPNIPILKQARDEYATLQ